MSMTHDYAAVVMPWGRYIDKKLQEIPPAYLGWILHKCKTTDPWLLNAIRKTLSDQEAADRAKRQIHYRLTSDGLRAWYTALARRFRNGTDGEIRVLIAAKAALDELLTEAPGKPAPIDPAINACKVSPPF